MIYNLLHIIFYADYSGRNGWSFFITWLINYAPSSFRAYVVTNPKTSSSWNNDNAFWEKL